GDALPQSRVAPRVEITLHGRTRRKIAGQGAPLTAGSQNVEDRLNDPAQIRLPRTAPPRARRESTRDQRPFRIGHVACEAQSFALIVRASDLSPRHRALPRIFANPME